MILLFVLFFFLLCSSGVQTNGKKCSHSHDRFRNRRVDWRDEIDDDDSFSSLILLVNKNIEPLPSSLSVILSVDFNSVWAEIVSGTCRTTVPATFALIYFRSTRVDRIEWQNKVITKRMNHIPIWITRHQSPNIHRWTKFMRRRRFPKHFGPIWITLFWIFSVGSEIYFAVHESKIGKVQWKTIRQYVLISNRLRIFSLRFHRVSFLSIRVTRVSTLEMFINVLPIVSIDRSAVYQVEHWTWSNVWQMIIIGHSSMSKRQRGISCALEHVSFRQIYRWENQNNQSRFVQLSRFCQQFGTNCWERHQCNQTSWRGDGQFTTGIR